MLLLVIGGYMGLIILGSIAASLKRIADSLEQK